jgi:hypothetical protein
MKTILRNLLLCAGALVLAGIVMVSCKPLPETGLYDVKVDVNKGFVSEAGVIVSYPQLSVIVSAPDNSDFFNVSATLNGGDGKYISTIAHQREYLSLDFEALSDDPFADWTVQVEVTRAADGASLYSKSFPLEFVPANDNN